MTIDEAKKSLQDNLDAEPGLIDDVNAAQQTLQKCFDNINALTNLIAEMENPAPIQEPDYSVPVKDTFMQAISASKQVQPEPIEEKKVAG